MPNTLDGETGGEVPHAKVFLSSLVHDSPEFGSDDEHAVSRAFLELWLDGALNENLYAQIRHPVGADLGTVPLEVSWPVGYRGPLDYDAFRAGIEAYYRDLVGSAECEPPVEGSADIRLQNNTFASPSSFEFEIDSSNDG